MPSYAWAVQFVPAIQHIDVTRRTAVGHLKSTEWTSIRDWNTLINSFVVVNRRLPSAAIFIYSSASIQHVVLYSTVRKLHSLPFLIVFEVVAAYNQCCIVIVVIVIFVVLVVTVIVVTVVVVPLALLIESRYFGSQNLLT